MIQYQGYGDQSGSRFFEELVASLLCLVGHVGEAGGLAGEELLADEPATAGHRRRQGGTMP